MDEAIASYSWANLCSNRGLFLATDRNLATYLNNQFH